eukprot:6195857-Pleurochrysis_carterae.AAC.3
MANCGLVRLFVFGNFHGHALPAAACCRKAAFLDTACEKLTLRTAYNLRSSRDYDQFALVLRLLYLCKRPEPVMKL